MNIHFHKPENTVELLPIQQPQRPTAMVIQLETVTPELAEELIGGNIDNRPSKPKHVKFLADQMRAGAWQVTGDPIKISASGRLLDGQHRLMAIIESQTSQQLYVARNCEDEIFSVLDTGRSRSASDVLATAGYKNYTNIAATAKILIMHERGVLANMGGKQRTSTNAAVLDYATRHDLNESVTAAHALSKRCKLLTPAEWGALHYLLTQLDAGQGAAFLQQINTGLNLTEGHPVFVLRQRLQQARDGRFNFSPAERMAITIKAWNAYRDGRKLTQLTWKNLEDFPVIE